MLHGITPRGPEISTPRGFEAAVQVACGAAHACLVHKSGQLYIWGMGGAGRLGLDLTRYLSLFGAVYSYYVGYIESRFCKSLPCCKFYLIKH
jgi:hypothetical protein